MSTGCAPHRAYLAALADGETELVPPVTLDHVRSCPECGHVLESHRALTSRLKEVPPVPGTPLPEPRRTRAGRSMLLAGVAVALAASGLAGWLALGNRPDTPVATAVAAASEPLQIRSSDPGTVGSWCRRASGRQVPMIELDSMTVLGARMDTSGSIDIVTVEYATASGDSFAIGWIEGQAPSGQGVSQSSVSGHEALIVHSPRGVAVVTGSSTSVMWEAAAALESL